MALTASRLEHAYALDLMSWPSEGRVLAVVSTPEFVDLTLARLVTAATFVCEGEETLRHARRRLEQGYLPDAIAGESEVRPLNELEAIGRAHTAAIWAAPQVGTWTGLLVGIERALEAGGSLDGLTLTRFGRVVKHFRRGMRRGEPDVSWSDIVGQLQRERWRVESMFRLGGAAGVWWAVIAKLAALAGRPDLADRAEQAHHTSVTDERGASFALVRARLDGRLSETWK